MSDELDKILQKALAKEASDRYATAEAFARDLEEFGKANKLFATQREVADFVKKVFPEEFTRGPRVDTVPFGASITLDMHHANDSSSGKSYVSQIPGAIRELEVDVGGYGELGHLLDSPVVAPLPLPASEPANTDAQVAPKQISKRAAPKRGSAGTGKSSGFGWKSILVTLLVLLGGVAVAHDQTDIVKDAVGNLSEMFEEKGPPEVSVDDNPLLREHGARILIASSPPGAKVYLDGKEQGVTPVALTGLMRGDYRVRVESPGFASWSTKVEVSQGETAGVTARLLGKQGGAQPGAFGRMSIEATPPADVYVAGDLIGRTPIEKIYAPLGRVTLNFELPDGRKVSREVDVKSDGVARAHFDLGNAKR